MAVYFSGLGRGAGSNPHEKGYYGGIAAGLDHLNRQAGGLAVSKALLEIEFNQRYNQKLDRFLILRPKRGDRDYLTLPREVVPSNYLIQLALRHVVPPVGAYPPQAANIDQIVQIALDMMAVLHLTDPE